MAFYLDFPASTASFVYSSFLKLTRGSAACVCVRVCACVRARTHVVKVLGSSVKVLGSSVEAQGSQTRTKLVYAAFSY